MKNHIMSKTYISATLLTLLFSVSVVSAAWNPPTATPPGGNTLPPIHTGSEAQSKKGNLILEGLDDTGAAKSLGFGVLNGNIGFGTINPLHKLSIFGGDLGFLTNGKGLRWTGISGWDWLISTEDTGAGSVPLYIKSNSAGAGLTTKFTISSAGDVGIGTITPGAKLEVAGQVKITGGSPGVGKVLTSDANGVASWMATSSLGISGGSTTTVLNGGAIANSGNLSIPSENETSVSWAHGLGQKPGFVRVVLVSLVNQSADQGSYLAGDELDVATSVFVESGGNYISVPILVTPTHVLLPHQWKSYPLAVSSNRIGTYDRLVRITRATWALKIYAGTSVGGGTATPVAGVCDANPVRTITQSGSGTAYQNTSGAQLIVMATGGQSATGGGLFLEGWIGSTAPNLTRVALYQFESTNVASITFLVPPGYYYKVVNDSANGPTLDAKAWQVCGGGGSSSSVATNGSVLKGVLTLASARAVAPTGAYVSDPITITGASVGDSVTVSLPSNYYANYPSTPPIPCASIDGSVISSNTVKVRFSNAYDGAACGVPAGTYNIYVGSSGGGSSSTGVSISDVRDSLEYKTCTIGGVGTSLQGVSTTCTSSCSSGKKVVSGSCTSSVKPINQNPAYPGVVEISAPNDAKTGWVCTAAKPSPSEYATAKGTAICL